MSITVREWIEKFNNGEFDSKDIKTQCVAGWIDWHCAEEELPGRLKAMGNIIKNIKDDYILDNFKVNFKNNCPVYSPLFDYFRFTPIKKGKEAIDSNIVNKLTFGVECGHPFGGDFMYEIFTGRSGYSVEFHCKNEQEVLKVITQLAKELQKWFLLLDIGCSVIKCAAPNKVFQLLAKWLYDFVSYPKNQTGNPTIDKAVRNAYSSDAKDRNGVVTSSKDTNYSGAFDSKSLIVYNADTAAENKADTTDAAYVANRGGYTSANNTEAGKDGKGYSNDFKYDDTTTASEGDLLDYRVVSKLPHITSKATYLSQYTFTDALSTGVNYNKDFKIAFYDNAADAKANNTKNAKEIWNLDGGKHEAAYATVTVSGEDGTEKVTANKATITLTEAGLNQINGTNVKGASKPYEAVGDKGATKAGYSDYYMVLYYTATVNSDASVTLGDSGNANDISLVWSRTNNKYSNSLQDRNYVYSYGIDLTKTFSDNKGDATKVQFKLYNSTDAYYVIAKKAEDGLYYVTGKTMDKAQATTFTPAASGKLYIKGLEGDKYQLTEVATDDGYTLLKDQMVININTTKRDIKASVAGTTGLDDAAADNIIANYGTGIKNEDGQLVNAATTDIGSKAVAGPTSETANGRTIGKTDMYVGDIQAATATVDSKPCTLLTSSTGDTTSPNAEVKMAIENNKGFNMPLTGGTGLVGLVILGAGLLGGGVYSMTRNKKKEETAC